MTWAHYAVLGLFVFTVGASVGSFLNVCIWRLPRGESLIRPRSRCPNCATPITARDNVPVLGWLALRGRCRHCAWPIPARYPLVEATVGLFFAVVVLVDLALAAAGPFERGPGAVLALLLYHLALVAVLVTLTMIARDERRGVAPPVGGNPWLVLVLVVSVLALTAVRGDLVGVILNGLLLAVFAVWLSARKTALGRVS